MKSVEEAQTVHRPSCPGAAHGINRSTASAVHADSQVGPAPGVAPWHGVVFAVLIILRIRCAVIDMQWPQTPTDTSLIALVLLHIPVDSAGNAS